MSNDKLSQELTDGLNESTLQVSAMISYVDKIGENMTKTIDAVMDAFKGESEERQKLLIAFKNLSEMLRKCQQTNTPLSMESLSPIQQDITTLSRGPEKNTSDQLTRLERELTTAKATIAQLQSQLNTILLKRDQLEGENKQLVELNNGYKE